MGEITPLRLTPGTIAGLYVVFGSIALVFSDVLLPRMLPAGSLLRDLQLLKGGVEVALTAGFVYVVVSYSQHSLATARDRLERNEQVLQVLLRLLRHNIRNEMNVVQGHAQTAKTECEDDDVAESCSAILDTTDELLERTETVNRLRDILDGTSESRPIELEGLVRETAAEARRQADDEATIRVDETEPVTVYANSLLPIAVGELVDNAVRHNDSPTPEVVLSVERDGDWVSLSIADNGPGIPDSERAVLSDLSESPLHHSSGLGLWFVYWAVTDSGGDVTFQDRNGEGTNVTIRLPTMNAATDRNDRPPVRIEPFG